MTLDVELPELPDLTNRGMPRDFELRDETLGSGAFHREELESLLRDGAWQEGFNEWSEYTELDAAQVRTVDDLGLFQAFDFYWDPTDERLQYTAPRVPADWGERDATASLDSSTVSMMNTELQTLGRTVQEVLEDYLDRSDEVSVHHWAEESFGERSE